MSKLRLFSLKQFFSFNSSLLNDLDKEETLAWDLLKNLNSAFSERNYTIESKLDKEVFLENENEIAIGKNCTVEKGAYIKGPCIIGDNVEIRSGAYIRGHVIIHNRALVGHGTEITRSLVFEGAHLAHLNYVGDSIIGAHVNLGAGSKLANLRLDKKEVMISFEREKIKTGLMKMGAILGDGVQVGCNAVLNPGTIVFPGKTILPCDAVRGVIA